MRISHFFATSIVAIFAFTESASATYVNQLEHDKFVLPQSDVMTEVAQEETEEEIARKAVISSFGWNGLNDNEKQRLTQVLLNKAGEY